MRVGHADVEDSSRNAIGPECGAMKLPIIFDQASITWVCRKPSRNPRLYSALPVGKLECKLKSKEGTFAFKTFHFEFTERTHLNAFSQLYVCRFAERARFA